MTAGKLFQKVTFQSPARSSDGYGGVYDGWNDQLTCRAAFMYSGGGETVQAARLEGRGVIKVRIRSFEDSRQITQDWRLKDERTGVIYNIREVDKDTDRFWIYILAERGVAP